MAPLILTRAHEIRTFIIPVYTGEAGAREGSGLSKVRPLDGRTRIEPGDLDHCTTLPPLPRLFYYLIPMLPGRPRGHPERSKVTLWISGGVGA